MGATKTFTVENGKTTDLKWLKGLISLYLNWKTKMVLHQSNNEAITIRLILK